MTASLMEINRSPHGVIHRASHDWDEGRLAVVAVVDSAMDGIFTQLAQLPELLGDADVMPIVVGPPHSMQIGEFSTIVNPLGFTMGDDGPDVQNDLAAYFIARHTIVDCYERHGRKGHVFVVTRHRPRPVDPTGVQTIIGDKLRRPIKAHDMWAEVRERYNVHALIPTGTPDAVSTSWVRTLGTSNVVAIDTLEDLPTVATELAR